MTSATFYNTAAHWTARHHYRRGRMDGGVRQRRLRPHGDADGDSHQRRPLADYDHRELHLRRQNIVLILDGDGNVIERELTGPAPSQVFASENAATNVVNWYLTDNQGSVRDVVQLEEGTPTPVDHLVYSAFGSFHRRQRPPPVTSRRSTPTAPGSTRKPA